MRKTRFYCEKIPEGLLTLQGPEAHHLIHVLRLCPGQEVELFDGKGTASAARIEQVNRKTAVLSVEQTLTRQRPLAGRVIIAASIAKGSRFDQLITQCTELGIDHIAAVLFQRTVKQASRTDAVKRFRNLTVSAAKQSGRLFLPEITGPEPLHETIAELKKRYPDCRFLFGGFSPQARPILSLVPTEQDVVAVTGPEGGMTEEEQQLLRAHGAIEVRLAGNILRVETAATAFAAILAAGNESR